MTKTKGASDDSIISESKKSSSKEEHKDNDKKIKALSLQISKLSYEDSLKELDLILSDLQNETLLVEELQFTYLKAKLYLKHCQELLDTIEQKVVQTDLIS